MKNVILIGYRCTGKTSVGKRLSERLGLPVLDTDDIITREARKSVGEIVGEGGWALFRRKEKEVIKRISSMKGCIIATGGGAFEDPENSDAMRGSGLFIWLTADVKIILERMIADRKTNDQRPPLSDSDFEAEATLIIKKRGPAYHHLADLTIDTSQKTIDSIADAICDFLSKQGGTTHHGKEQTCQEIPSEHSSK
ncbi:MAG: shikimate kinase [Syntrophales bacterium]|nr:shikimate kinase [Syntrophales bacterium]